MTNLDFVYNYKFTPDKHHGNLFTDSHGTMYSYGYHYPLLFKVNGLVFVNTYGYSNTTSKHIGYAKRYAQYCVELDYTSHSIEYENVMRCLEKSLEYVNKQLAELKRHNTIKESNLLREQAELERTIEDLRATQ